MNDVPDVPPLRELYLYVTGRCNLRCAHCWVSAGEISYTAPELTTQELKDVIDQALPLGLQAIKITGGEPFIRPDVIEVLEYAANLGLRTRAESNGSYITGELADRLAAIPNHYQSISLDGYTPESHAILRGSTKSYFAARRAIELLTARGVAVEIITVVHRDNVQDVPLIASFADEVGCRSYKLNHLVDMGRGAYLQVQALSLSDMIRLIQWVQEELKPRHLTPIYVDAPVAFRAVEEIRRTRAMGCCIANILGVLADGRLSFCGAGFGMEDLIFGNIRDTLIAEVWYNSHALAKLRRVIMDERQGVCKRCLVRKYCRTGHCRAHAFARYGDLTVPYPLCHDAYEAGLFPSSRLLPD